LDGWGGIRRSPVRQRSDARRHRYLSAASVDTFAESIGQTGNALFKEHCRAVAVELQEGIFAETNSFAAQISGRTPMTIEEFVAKNRAAFI